MIRLPYTVDDDPDIGFGDEAEVKALPALDKAGATKIADGMRKLMNEGLPKEPRSHCGGGGCECGGECGPDCSCDKGEDEDEDDDDDDEQSSDDFDSGAEGSSA